MWSFQNRWGQEHKDDTIGGHPNTKVEIHTHTAEATGSGKKRYSGHPEADRQVLRERRVQKKHRTGWRERNDGRRPCAEIKRDE